MFNISQPQPKAPGLSDQVKQIPGAVMGTRRAVLYVFTPKDISHQYLRPFKYNFTSNMIDELAEASHSIRLNSATAVRNVVMPIGKHPSEDVCKAVLPAAQGIPLDTRPITNQPIFVLVADKPYYCENTRISAASPVVRTVSTGYCTDMPCNIATGTVNPSAVLVFTKSVELHISVDYGQPGPITRTPCHHDVDLVGSTVGQVAPSDTPLRLGTPDHLLRDVDVTLPEGPCTINEPEVDLSHDYRDAPIHAVNGKYKTSLYNLEHLVSTTNAAISACNDYKNGTSASLMSESISPDDVFIYEHVRSNLHGDNLQVDPRTGINVQMPISMQELCAMFPNALDVLPYQVPWQQTKYSTTPQGDMSPRNMASALLTASLGDLLPQCGLLGITFLYDSTANRREFGMGDDEGVMDILDYAPVTTMTPIEAENNIKMFTRLFADRLVPVVRIIGGEFKLSCRVDLIQTTLVNLIYLDDHSIKPTDGFYETSGRFSGFTNPMLADHTTFCTNASQFHYLVNAMGIKDYGPHPYAQFSQPTTNYGTVPC